MSRTSYLPLAICVIAFGASGAHADAVADAKPAALQLQSSPSVTISNGLIDATIAPVSYTHLDVYKRQELTTRVSMSPLKAPILARC